MLRRWLRTSLALTGRFTRLRESLSTPRLARDEDSSLLWAAVAAVLTPDPHATLLLIRRAERPGDPWSGHMALPGGRRESGDEGLLATAIRETYEEVGITLRKEHLLGSLEDVIPRIPVLPPVAVRPFVFLMAGQPPLVLNSEVASASWVRLDHLLNPAAHRSLLLDIPGPNREVQAYQLGDSVVWGMTERILTSLIHHLRD